MDFFDISIIAIAVAVSILTARLSCWLSIMMFKLDRKHWVGKSWLWIPLVCFAVFLLLPVYSDQPRSKEIQELFLCISLGIPLVSLVSAILFGVIASARAKSAISGKNSA